MLLCVHVYLINNFLVWQYWLKSFQFDEWVHYAVNSGTSLDESLAGFSQLFEGIFSRGLEVRNVLPARWVFDWGKTSPDISSSPSIPLTSSNPFTHTLIYTEMIKAWNVSQGSFGFAMQLFHVNFLFPFSSPQFTPTSCHNIVSLRENNKPKQMCWTHGHQQEQFPSKVSMWNHSKRGMSYPKNNLHLLLLFSGLKKSLHV